MRDASTACGAPVMQYVYAADLRGVSAWNVRTLFGCIPLLTKLTKAVELHFPEIVSQIILFNCPRVFVSVYNVGKGFLDPVTVQKIEMHAGVPNGLTGFHSVPPNPATHYRREGPGLRREEKCTVRQF